MIAAFATGIAVAAAETAYRSGSSQSRSRLTPLEGRTLLFGSQRKSLPGHVRDLKDLTVKYAKQETLDPLKSLGRFLLWGTIGSFCLGVGFVLLTLAALRALQAETGSHFTDHLSWVPYVITLAFCVLIVVASAYAIGAERRRSDRRKSAREAEHRAKDAS